MFIATLETSHFTFTAAGDSIGGARQTLRRAWLVHADATGADPDYLEDHADDVAMMEIVPGQAFRDGEPINVDAT